MPDWLPPLLASPFVGSMLGVLIRRLPAGRPVAVARSRCEACDGVLAARDMVPLLSFVWLRGRCRACGAAIAAFHWQVELAALALAAGLLMVDVATGATAPLLWADCALGWGLLALAWIDWQHQRLPDALSLPLLVLGLGATWWLDPDALLDHAIGATGGYVAFRVVALAYRAWRGREGLGHGDAKLLAVAGAWVGWQGLDTVVLLGALLSIGVALVQRRGWPDRAQRVPFGPGLALALLVVRMQG